jgi:hypothetical protein
MTYTFFHVHKHVVMNSKKNEKTNKSKIEKNAKYGEIR